MASLNTRRDMTETPYGIIELLLVFGSVLGLGFWELFSLRRDRKRAQNPEATKPGAAEKPGDPA
jgi:hypothetical protein